MKTREGAAAKSDARPFCDAFELLGQAWPLELEDIHLIIQVIVPYAPPPGWVVGGFTVSSHQGACWIAAKELVSVIEHVVHEHSHVKLRYIEESLPILEPEQPTDRFQIGWRSDPRPLIGIYEGVYVNIHSITALRRIARSRVLTSSELDSCEVRVCDLMNQIREGIEILYKHARFTQAGCGFLPWAEAALDQVAR